ncbi:(2Fe-2S)-binding protein [Streptomyces sp. TS71-3]|uniref:(2Fe-2S)-binding protein n=1 Tax=Streptomyces sp. TS71-3 TaxID=2733862 RepID=UPI001B021C78|nr:(2Fe-2S)-binding protein [Streptomyces sp. TS71-3]GHJ36509.1 hypothetical protein Sm713_21180 [Streptomyces sp. TS71-3]
MSEEQHDDVPGTHRGWQPIPQGEYDADATAFVQLPEGLADFDPAADTPLAAPGHGYVPPQIAVSPADAGAPGAAGQGPWGMPGPHVTPQEPARGAATGQTVHWPDPGTLGAQEAHQHPGEHDPAQAYQDPYGYHPGMAGHAPGGAAPATGPAGTGGPWHVAGEPGQHGAGVPADPAQGGGPVPPDAAGEWSIPVLAEGELPDESGEFTATALAAQWGRGTPPATLPGGATAPWATETGAGQPWDAASPADRMHHQGARAQQAGTQHPEAAQEWHDEAAGQRAHQEQAHGPGTGTHPGAVDPSADPAGGFQQPQGLRQAQDQQRQSRRPLRQPRPDEPQHGAAQEPHAPGRHDQHAPGPHGGPADQGRHDPYGAQAFPPGGPEHPGAGGAPADGTQAPGQAGPVDPMGPMGPVGTPALGRQPGAGPAGHPGATGFPEAPAGPGQDDGTARGPGGEHGPGGPGDGVTGRHPAAPDAGQAPLDQDADDDAIFVAPPARETTLRSGAPESPEGAEEGAFETSARSTRAQRPRRPLQDRRVQEPPPDGAPQEHAPQDTPWDNALQSPPWDDASGGAPLGHTGDRPAQEPADAPGATDPTPPGTAASAAVPAPTAEPAGLPAPEPAPLADAFDAAPAATAAPAGAPSGVGQDADAADAEDATPAAGLPVTADGADDDPGAASALGSDEHPLSSYVLRVNGTDRPVTGAWIGESLLYVLRERLGLAGAKDGCSQGECGACNVQVDGRLVASCLVPAATTAGSEVRTVEGLATDGRPSDVQRALADCGAVQCGFCVPGMAMTVHDLLEGNPDPSDLAARQALSGNLCRCSGYRGVLDAVRQVAGERRSAGRDAQDGQGGEGGGDADGPRIPHQAGPGAGGAHPAYAGGAPAAYDSAGYDGGPYEDDGYEDDGGRA